MRYTIIHIDEPYSGWFQHWNCILKTLRFAFTYLGIKTSTLHSTKRCTDRITNLFNLLIYITNVDFDRSFIESDIMLYFKFKDHFKATFYCLSIFLLGFWSFAIFLEAEINDCNTKLRSEGAGDKNYLKKSHPVTLGFLYSKFLKHIIKPETTIFSIETSVKFEITRGGRLQWMGGGEGSYPNTTTILLACYEMTCSCSVYQVWNT